MIDYQNITEQQNLTDEHEDTLEADGEEYISLRQLLDMDLPLPKFLVENVLLEGDVSILVAPPNSYKTWLAYEIAACVATGRKFLGTFETKQTRVLIMDGEMGLRNYNYYVRALGLEETPDAPIVYHSLNGEYGDYQILSSGDKDSSCDFFENLLNYCNNQHIGLIIFDSLSKLHGEDENNSTAMTKLFSHFAAFKDANITCLIIHHSRKGGSSFGGGSLEGTRGSSAIVASTDATIHIRKLNDGTAYIWTDKLRGSSSNEQIKAKLERVDNAHSRWIQIEKISAKEEVLSNDRSSLLEFIKEHPGLNQTTLSKTINNSGDIEIPHNRFLKLLNSLVEEGLIVKKRGHHSEQLIYASENFEDGASTTKDGKGEI